MNIPTQDLPYGSVQVAHQREINTDVFELIYWLQQELLSPELQPYYDVIKIQDALRGQLNSIQQLKKNLSKDNRQKETQYLTLHVIEMERVQYFYQQYLRIRMQKIFTHGFYYYNNIADLQLSLKEKDFLKNMVEKQVDYLFTNCLQYFQKSQRNFGVRLDNQNESQTQQEDKIAVQKPETHQYVVIHVNTQRTIHIGSIALSERDCALVCYDDNYGAFEERDIDLNNNIIFSSNLNEHYQPIIGRGQLYEIQINLQCLDSTSKCATPKEKEEQLNLLQNTIFSNLLMAQQMQSASQQQSSPVPVVSKSKKISKRNNDCGHPDKEHYAKGMCNNCYHKFGRTKKPWICGHEKLYAQGLCQNCYINKYNQKRREQGDSDQPKLEDLNSPQLEVEKQQSA